MPPSNQRRLSANAVTGRSAGSTSLPANAANPIACTISARCAAGSVLETVPGLEHALADELGTDPAPQAAGAAVVDRIVADWFGRRL
jgi:hypothetical protein